MKQHQNNITITGNVGKVSFFNTSKGNTAANLRVATNLRFRNEKQTEWHTATTFAADHVATARKINTGDTVTITGSLRTRKFTDRQGVVRYATEIRIATLEIEADNDGNGSRNEGDDESPSDAPGLTDSDLGDGEVINDDSVKGLVTLPDAYVDFILTDPPYLVNYRDRSGRTIAGDKDASWLEPVAHELYRVLKDDSFMVSFYGAYEVEKFMSAWKNAGFRPIGHLIGVKDYASGNSFTERRHECAYVLAKGNPKLPGSRLPDVLPWGEYTGNRLHPTQKPVGLLRRIIDSFSRYGDRVLDPFAGSGSTLLAAKLEGRDYIGFEIDADYSRIAQERLNLKPLYF